MSHVDGPSAMGTRALDTYPVCPSLDYKVLEVRNDVLVNTLYSRWGIPNGFVDRFFWLCHQEMLSRFPEV